MATAAPARSSPSSFVSVHGNRPYAVHLGLAEIVNFKIVLHYFNIIILHSSVHPNRGLSVIPDDTAKASFLSLISGFEVWKSYTGHIKL